MATIKPGGIAKACGLAVLLLAGCAQPPNLVVLRRDDDGQIGRAIVTHDGAAVQLDQPNMTARNAGGQVPQDVAVLRDDQIISIFAGAMAAQPQRPSFFVVYYGVGSVDILPDSLPALADAIKASQLTRFADVSALGHADASGNAQQNLILSRKRADGVRAAFIASGTDPAGITAAAIGDTPTPPGAQKSEAEGQRAVEIIVR